MRHLFTVMHARVGADYAGLIASWTRSEIFGYRKWEIGIWDYQTNEQAPSAWKFENTHTNTHEFIGVFCEIASSHWRDSRQTARDASLLLITMVAAAAPVSFVGSGIVHIVSEVPRSRRLTNLRTRSGSINYTKCKFYFNLRVCAS